MWDKLPHMNLRCCLLLHTLVINVGHDTPHELRILHITRHDGHLCGTSYPHMNLRCRILLQVLVIIVGHVTTT